MYNIEDFGRMIAEKRKLAGLTQEALAKKLGISPQAVSKWENGIGYPDVTLFPPLSEALGVPIDTLFGSGKGSADGGYEGPEYFNGLSFVASNGDVACYSGKKPNKVESGVVYFADGSTADLNTQVVMNRGKGEIRIVKGEIKRDSNCNAKQKSVDLDLFKSVDISLPGAIMCEVTKGNKPSLSLEGNKKFIDAADWSVVNGRFRLDFSSDTAESNGKNRITLVCPFEKGDNFSVSIVGSGDCTVVPDFSSIEAEITGSGMIGVKNCDILNAIVTGSGAISADAVLEKYTGEITGSGYLGVNKVKNASVTITGSGEAEMKNVFDRLKASISGSGMITADGYLDSLNLGLSGSGSFRGDRLTCECADINASGSGEISVGTIKKESVEKLSKNVVLTVKNRGE